ncbi:MAG: hypothetical protein ACI9LU_002161 [Polaribacter sp.]|jgi:hypothetical protein
MNVPKLEEWNLQRRSVVLACVILFFSSLLFYDQTFQYDFSRYDDHKIIGEHPQLYSDGTVAESAKQILYLDFPREEPLLVRDLSWLADSIVFGYNRPFGYHYGNVIYHAFTLVLAFLLILRLTNAGTALLSAPLLLVLAAHAEPVAWIMGRKDILSSMFSLLSIILFLCFQDKGSGRSKNWLYLLSIVFAGAAFLSKLNAVILPGVLFFCALINRKDVVRDGFRTQNLARILGKVLVQVLPFFILGLTILLWYRSVLSDYGLLGRALVYSPEDYRKLLFIVNPLIFLEYLKIILIPWDLEAYYSAPSIFSKLSGAQITQAVLVVVLTLTSTVLLWRFNRVACLFILCFIVVMLPYGNWIHFGFWYANRYVYFSSFFLIAGLCSAAVALQAQEGARVIKMAVALSLGWVFTQNVIYRSQYVGVWENGESLWKHEISLPGASIHDYNNLTGYYIGKSENALPDKKEAWLEKAQSVNEKVFNLNVPSHERGWLGVAHYYKGLTQAYSGASLESQLSEFLKAVSTSLNYSKALRSTGVVYYQMSMQEADPVKRAELSRQSLFYLRRYFATRSNDSGARAEQLEILGILNKNFPDLDIQVIETVSGP